MRPVNPKAARVKSVAFRVLIDIYRCAYVYVRIDGMTNQYDGPYRVIRRCRNTFLLDKDGRPFSVSVNRLKPANGVD